MLRKLYMSRVILCNVLLIDLIFLLPELILCAMFSHKFSFFLFFSRCYLCCIYVCCIYLYFSFSTLWWMKLIIARTRNVSEYLYVYSLYARLCSLDGVRPRVICWAWLRHRAHAYFMRRRWRICRYQSVTGGRSMDGPVDGTDRRRATYRPTSRTSGDWHMNHSLNLRRRAVSRRSGALWNVILRIGIDCRIAKNI